MRFYENSPYAEDPGAIVSLDLLSETDRDEMAKLCYALGNPVRLKILSHMQREPRVFSVSAMVKALGIPTTTLLFHLEKMQQAGLVNVIYKSSGRGTQRFVTRKLHGADLRFYKTSKEIERQESETYSLGVGQFCDFKGSTFSFCTATNGFHSPNNNSFCYIPERFDAQLLYTDKGIITYRFGNLPALQHKIKKIALSLEICSEAPYFDNDYLSDITFWINGKEIATYTCPGDFGDHRGRLNPDWWSSDNTQYGQLITLAVTENGVEINGARVSSSVGISNLKLDKNNYTEVSFGNKDTALNPGGFNLFGRMFGDHPQDVLLTFFY